MTKWRLTTGLVCALSISVPALADIDAGKHALENRDFGAVIKLVKPDLSEDNTNFEANWLTGQASYLSGEVKKSLEFFEEAIEINPAHAEAQYSWGQARCDMINGAGFFAMMGHAKACYKAFERTVKLNPDHLDAREGLVQYYIHAPSIAGGGTDKAMLQVEEITKRDPLLGAVQLAMVYQAQDETDKALETYAEVLQIAPTNMDALFGRGLLYRELEQYDEAFDDFQALISASKAPQEDADEAKEFGGLGQYFFGSVASLSGKRLEEGASILEAYIAAGSYDSPGRASYGRYYLATVYFALNNIEKAKKLAAEVDGMDKDKDLKKRLKKLEKKLRKA